MCQPSMNHVSNCSVDAKDVVSGDDLDLTLEFAFKQFEQERFKSLMQVLKKTMLGKVIPRCTKVLNLDDGSLLDLHTDTLKSVLMDMVNLGEQEPYGVMGGTLIINFGNADSGIGNSDVINNSLSFTKIGRFPLNTSVTSTFELHLTLYPSTHVKHKVGNLIRKLKGRPTKLVVAEKYTLTKKKLYRSASHIN